MDERLLERLALAAAGAAHGAALWLLVETWPEGPAARAVAAAGLTFLAVTALVLHFAWTGAARARLAALTLATGLVYAAVAGWVGWKLPTRGPEAWADEQRGVTWMLASLVTLYVLGPFLQIFQRTGRAHFPYRELFLHGWSNFFVALVALLFVGALWTVLLLWAALFDLVGIELFEDLFTEAPFVWTVTGGAAGFGIALGRESERVVGTLRGITLAVFRGLLPIVAFVALIFLATLPFTGLEGLWRTDRAAQILLAWVGLTVLFLNAVYQDGSGVGLPPAWIRRGVEAALLAMTVFAGVAAYGIALRIGQYGLTPPRFWGVLFTLVLGGYALGYALAVVRQGAPWLRMVRAVNLAMALVVVALGLLTHTPALDPIAWSARSQVARLVEGRVAAEEFDYGYLRFQLGREGRRALERLEALEAHPELAEVRTGIAAARAAESYWDWQKRHGPGLALEDFRVLPPGTVLPEGLFEFARTQGVMWTGVPCDAPNYCAVFPAELDGRPPDEWVFVVAQPHWSHVVAVARTRAGYESLGPLHSRGPVPGAEEIRESLEALRFGARKPRYRDVRIGDMRFGVTPP